MQDFQELARHVQSKLSQKRFYHTTCVVEMAENLAEVYGCNIEKMRLAALLHDILKDTPDGELLQMLQQYGIIINYEQRKNPALLHSIAGAEYIRRQLGITDEQVCNAVKYHTSARAGMSLFETVLFVADAVSKDRHYPGVEQLAQQAFTDLDKTAFEILHFTLITIVKQARPLYLDTVLAYNDFSRRIEEREV